MAVWPAHLITDKAKLKQHVLYNCLILLPSQWSEGRGSGVKVILNYIGSLRLWNNNNKVEETFMFTYLDCANGIICRYMLGTLRLYKLDMYSLLLSGCFSMNTNIATILGSITLSPWLLYHMSAHSYLPSIYGFALRQSLTVEPGTHCEAQAGLRLVTTILSQPLPFSDELLCPAYLIFLRLVPNSERWGVPPH